MCSQALPAPAKQLFRYLFEQASLGIAVKDLEGKLLLANPALCSMLGYTEEELCGMSCSQFASPEDAQADWVLFQQLRAGVIDQYSLEKRYVRKDGAQLWGHLNVSLLKEGDGGPPLVFAFVEEITERKLAEQELARSNERFRLAVEAGKSVGWEWDIKSGRDSWFGDLQTMFGIASDTFVGRVEDFYGYVHPEDREMVAKAVSDARQSRKPYAAEFRVVRLDGTVRWVSATGQFYYDSNGDAERMFGLAADITERKRTEEALRKSEERFRLAAQAGKMFAYEWDAATDVIVRSAESAEILGIDEAAQVTGQEVLAKVHPEDRERLKAAVAGLSPEKSYLQISYRMVRPDGTTVWVERSSRAHFDEQGRMLRIIGMVADITHRKLAETALSNVSRKLIEAQEQERTRIGRDLHDDIGQRLSLLAVELQQLHEEPPMLPEVRGRIGELQKQTSEIAADVQSLSHELHSAKLQYLGIAAAMRGFCQEFGEQTRVKVEFKSHDLPSPLSPDISLCLFRVLQEALHNSAKHSGVQHFDVRLWGTLDEIHLTVKDFGIGFDSEAAKKGRGLGLISMEERLKLLKGTLSIESKFQRGTTIHARVPLGSENDSMRAAG